MVGMEKRSVTRVGMHRAAVACVSRRLQSRMLVWTHERWRSVGSKCVLFHLSYRIWFYHSANKKALLFISRRTNGSNLSRIEPKASLGRMRMRRERREARSREVWDSPPVYVCVAVLRASISTVCARSSNYPVSVCVSCGHRQCVYTFSKVEREETRRKRWWQWQRLTARWVSDPTGQ